MAQERFYLGRIFESAKDDESEAELRRAMAELADELNGIAKQEVTIEHLDTKDYLTFRPRPPGPC